MSTSIRSLYLTFPDLATAELVGRALLDARLVACVNILPSAVSLYRWQGEVQRDSEVVAFAKTRSDRVAEATALVRRLHPYDVPCIVGLSVEAGDPAYLRWVEEEAGS